MFKRILIIAVLLLFPGLAMAQSTTFTNQPEVDLDLTGDDAGGSGVVQRRFSNDGITWGEWEPFKLTRENWTLNPGDGPKDIWLQLKDYAGNESQPIGPAQITKDTIPPTGTITISAGSVNVTIGVSVEGE